MLSYNFLHLPILYFSLHNDSICKNEQYVVSGWLISVV